jgi:hypothetical protein
MFTGIVSAINESEPWTYESVIIAVFIVTAPLGIFIAWLREGIGGILLILYAVAFSTFGYISAGHNKPFAMVITGAPFLVIGILFLTSWWKSRRSTVLQNGI